MRGDLIQHGEDAHRFTGCDLAAASLVDVSGKAQRYYEMSDTYRMDNLSRNSITEVTK
jgi:hypothetical protein